MPKLFVGSHGTLGILCDITLKLAPLPRNRTTLVVPVPTLAQGLHLSRELATRSIVASAVILCNDDVAGEPLSPYTLLYTAEGLHEDVTAELREVVALLQRHGLVAHEVDSTGTIVWADWLRAHVAAGHDVLRIGVPPSQCSATVEALAAHPATSFLVDVLSNQIYTLGDVCPVLPRIAAGGYAVPLLAGRAQTTHIPSAVQLSTQLAHTWGSNGRLNPGAFPVNIAKRITVFT